jgi:hypothetical protein
MEPQLSESNQPMIYQNCHWHLRSLRSIVAAALIISVSPYVQAARPPAGKLHGEMRKLWHDHVALTREWTLQDVASQATAKPTLQRLLHNQVEIGNAFKLYYGKAAGDQLTALLKEHIIIATRIVVSGKKAPVPSLPATDEWFKNADQIAAQLHQLNPQYWSYEEMKKMMHHHLKITTAEVLAALRGGESIGAYEKVHQQAMEMADMLTAGIQKQFGGARSGAHSST